MKKLYATFGAVIVILVNLGLMAVSPAYADTRVNISASRPAVFVGSTSIVTARAYLDEADPEVDSGLFKYEINSVMDSKFEINLTFSQLASSYCDGEVTPLNSSIQSCESVFTGSHNVIYASTNQYSIGGTLNFKQTSGSSQLFRLRAWVDRNDNDRIDPYEPMSPISTINTVDPESVPVSLNFNVDPPRHVDGKISTWFAYGGFAGKAIDLFDPELIKVKVHSCLRDFCERVSGTTTYNNHPQLKRYEFITSIPSWSRTAYAVQVFYQKDEDTPILLDTVEFDYSKPVPTGVTTDLTSVYGFTKKTSTEIPGYTPQAKTVYVNPGYGEFTYTAKFEDKDSSLTSNRDVYVYLDLKSLTSPENLLVDGVFVTPTKDDQVILNRITNSEGEISLNLRYLGDSFEELGIDVQINGVRSNEFAKKGSEQVILWDSLPDRTIAISGVKGMSAQGETLTLEATVYGPNEATISDGSVIFKADRELVLDKPVARISNSKANTNVRVSNLAKPSGTAFVYGRVLSSSGWVVARIEISWRARGAEITVGKFTSKSVFPSTSKARVTLSTISKVNVITVTGLRPYDIVLIRRGAYYIKPVFNRNNVKPYPLTWYSVATAKYPVGKANAKFEVLVNGKVIFTKITK